MAELYIRNPTLSEIREAKHQLELEKQLEQIGVYVPGIERIRKSYNGAIMVPYHSR